jgi:hypothetical protein
MIASLLLFAAIALRIAKQSIQPSAASVMALERNTKKHQTDLMTPKDFKYTPQPLLSL